MEKRAPKAGLHGFCQPWVLQSVSHVFNTLLGRGLKHFLFLPLFRGMIQFEEHFLDGWLKHQLV